MKLWKRNAVVAAIVLFVCVAVYLNWSYNRDAEASDAGKRLGEATLVAGPSGDPLLENTGLQPSSTPAMDQEGEASQTGGEPAGQDGTAVNGEDDPALTQAGDYFDSARLNRQQARDSALTLLQEAAGDEAADQTVKDEANASIQTMAGLTVSEAQIENLVTAKGYDDCIAFIGENSVSVVVSNGGNDLTDADVARITEIVTDETGRSPDQVKIIKTAE